MDSQHIGEEIKGTFDALDAMLATSTKIVSESPAEKNEGHFTEMQRFQEAARLAANKFLAAQKESKPNYSEMKKFSAEILKNLEEAKHWHELELSEIEHNQKD